MFSKTTPTTASTHKGALTWLNKINSFIEGSDSSSASSSSSSSSTASLKKASSSLFVVSHHNSNQQQHNQQQRAKRSHAYQQPTFSLSTASLSNRKSQHERQQQSRRHSTETRSSKFSIIDYLTPNLSSSGSSSANSRSSSIVAQSAGSLRAPTPSVATTISRRLSQRTSLSFSTKFNTFGASQHKRAKSHYGHQARVSANKANEKAASSSTKLVQGFKQELSKLLKSLNVSNATHLVRLN